MTGNLSVDFLYFMFYSFLGWICEVIFCSVLERQFVNRGFLNGPVCPIYGFGAVLVISFLTPLADNIWLVFVFGILLTSSLEYITGYALEKIFHTKWWDYSNHLFNIRGRVCLTNSILFGILSVVLMFVIHARVALFVKGLNFQVVQLLAVSFFVIITADTVLTVWSVLRLNKTITYLKELTAQAHQRLEEREQQMEDFWVDYVEKMKENLNFTAETAKLKELLKTHFYLKSEVEQFCSSRLMGAFPKMKPIKREVQLQHLRQIIEEIRQEKRNQRRKNRKSY